MAMHPSEVDIWSDQWATKMELIPCPVYDGIPLPSFIPLREDCNKRMNDILHFDSRETDIIICTFAKSGTHWSSEILMMLLEDKNELLETSKIDTMMEATTNFDNLNNLTNRRILDSHLRPRMLPKKHVDNKYKIIHIIRNPKDVCVSFYHHAKKDIACGPKSSWNEWVDKFLSGDVPYGSWFSHVKEFEEFQKGHPDFLLLYYEDLHKDFESSVKKIADFIGVKTTKTKIETIRKVTTFDNMAQNKIDFSKMVTGDGKGFIFRKGIVSDWKNHFTDDQNRRFDEKFKKEMDGSSYKFTFEL